MYTVVLLEGRCDVILPDAMDSNQYEVGQKKITQIWWSGTELTEAL